MDRKMQTLGICLKSKEVEIRGASSLFTIDEEASAAIQKRLTVF